MGLTERQWRSRKGWETRRRNAAARDRRTVRLFDAEFLTTAWEASDTLRNEESVEREEALAMFAGRPYPGVVAVTLNLDLYYDGELVHRYQPTVYIHATNATDALDQVVGRNGLYLRAVRRIMAKLDNSDYTIVLRSIRVENAPDTRAVTDPDEFEEHFERGSTTRRRKRRAA